MHFSTLLALFPIALTSAAPIVTECTSQAYKLRAIAPGSNFDGKFLKLDEAHNGFASLHFNGLAPRGDLRMTFAGTRSAPGPSYSLHAGDADIVLSGAAATPYFRTIGVQGFNTGPAEGQMTGRWQTAPCELDKYKDCLSYGTLPAAKWVATSTDGGQSWYANLYDKSKGPIPNPVKQQAKEFKLEVVKA